MIAPDLYWVFIYMLGVPLSAVVCDCIIGPRKVWKWVIIVLLASGIVISLFLYLSSIIDSMIYPLAVCGFGLYCTGKLAVECVMKRKDGELKFVDVVWAVGSYLLFFVIGFLAVPHLRWCEGCMEWH